jgi:hypothetical protein
MLKIKGPRIEPRDTPLIVSSQVIWYSPILTVCFLYFSVLSAFYCIIQFYTVNKRNTHVCKIHFLYISTILSAFLTSTIYSISSAFYYMFYTVIIDNSRGSSKWCTWVFSCWFIEIFLEVLCKNLQFPTCVTRSSKSIWHRAMKLYRNVDQHVKLCTQGVACEYICLVRVIALDLVKICILCRA